MARGGPQDPSTERWRRAVEARRPSGPPLTRHAARLGLKLERSDRGRLLFTGRRRGLRVVLERRPVPDSHLFDWTVRVEPPGLADSLTIKLETRLGGAMKLISGEDVLTGDEPFDRRYKLAGDPLLLAALLDATTRRHLGRWARFSFALRGGVLRLVFRGRREDRPPPALDLELSRLCAVAHRLSAEGRSPAERLHAVARRDPVPGVQARAALALLSRWPERVEPPLLRRLERAAVRADPLGGEVLALLLALSERDEVLGQLSERTLCEMLPEARSRAQLRLLARLEQVGGTECLAAVLPWTSGLLLRGRVKEAARRVVAAVEERTQIRRGQLSLLAAGAGQLSRAPAGEGAVSVPGEEPPD